MNKNGNTMTPFARKLHSNPSRMVVLFRQGEDGGEEFQWGVVGNIPLLTLIGSIVEVQPKLIYGHTSIHSCNESAFVIIVENKEISYWKYPSIPTLPLLGMLETIKLTLVGSRLGQQAAAQKTQILGPDGIPAANRIKRL